MNIIASEAIVLKKIQFSDSSLIVTLYTPDNGKISAILKGARRKESKFGKLLDPPNLINITYYLKTTRDVQTISSVDLIEFYPEIKSNLDSIKYVFGALELVYSLIPEHESNERLFRGLKKILSNFNSKNESPALIFLRFYLFFLQEIGFEVQLIGDEKKIGTSLKETNYYFSFEKGLIIGEANGTSFNKKISKELFEMLICLMRGKKVQVSSEKLELSAIELLNNFLRFHEANFKGINSLKLY